MKSSKMSIIVRPDMLNAWNKVFGGKMLEWMDEIGGMAALRFVGSDVVTVAVEQVNFLKPVYQAAMLDVVGAVVSVGSTSLKVRVEIMMDDLLGGADIKMAEGTFVYVAVDADGKPKKIGKTIPNA